MLYRARNSSILWHRYKSRYSLLEKRIIADEYIKTKKFKQIWNKFNIPKSTLFSIIKSDRNERIPNLISWFQIQKSKELSREWIDSLLKFINPPQGAFTISELQLKLEEKLGYDIKKRDL